MKPKPGDKSKPRWNPNSKVTLIPGVNPKHGVSPKPGVIPKPSKP